MIRIMIIEDEINSAKHLASYVNSYGHQFEVLGICKNTNDARNLFYRLNPEVVFCDIKLGKDNGLELINEFRNSEWYGHVIIISGYKDYSYMREAIKLNVDDYLLKPVFPQDIEKALEAIVVKIEKSSLNIKGNILNKACFPNFINKALDYVTLNYTEEISLINVAQYASVSLTYLSSRFKKYTGFSFIEYLNKYRIELAKEKLLETNLTLEQIAAQVGFNDVIYFNKLFKRYSGCSPGKFRKNFEDRHEKN